MGMIFHVAANTAQWIAASIDENPRIAKSPPGRTRGPRPKWGPSIKNPGTPTLDRVGRVGLADMGEGRGSTGSPTARHVRRALDVGLDFSLPFYQEKGRKKPSLYLHWIVIFSKHPPKLQLHCFWIHSNPLKVSPLNHPSKAQFSIDFVEIEDSMISMFHICQLSILNYPQLPLPPYTFNFQLSTSQLTLNSKLSTLNSKNSFLLMRYIRPFLALEDDGIGC